MVGVDRGGAGNAYTDTPLPLPARVGALHPATEAAPRGGLMRGRLKRYRRRQPPRSASSRFRSPALGSMAADDGRQLSPSSGCGRISALRPSGVTRGGGRQQVGSLVERVADVTLDPVPANLLVVCRRGV